MGLCGSAQREQVGIPGPLILEPAHEPQTPARCSPVRRMSSSCSHYGCNARASTGSQSASASSDSAGVEISKSQFSLPELPYRSSAVGNKTALTLYKLETGDTSRGRERCEKKAGEIAMDLINQFREENRLQGMKTTGVLCENIAGLVQRHAKAIADKVPTIGMTLPYRGDRVWMYYDAKFVRAIGGPRPEYISAKLKQSQTKRTDPKTHKLVTEYTLNITKPKGTWVFRECSGHANITERQSDVKNYGAKDTAENVGKVAEPTPEEAAKSVVEGWKNSERHRAGMLKPTPTHQAMGVYYDEKTGYWHFVHMFCQS